MCASHEAAPDYLEDRWRLFQEAVMIARSGCCRPSGAVFLGLAPRRASPPARGSRPFGSISSPDAYLRVDCIARCLLRKAKGQFPGRSARSSKQNSSEIPRRESTGFRKLDRLEAQMLAGRRLRSIFCIRKPATGGAAAEFSSRLGARP